MSKIFISYAREDRPFVEKLAAALEFAGHSVWFDRELKSGSFRDQIVAQLDGAEVAIVVWSARSKGSRYVLDESERAAARGILLPVKIDGSEVPLGFGSLQTLDLSAWSGVVDSEGFGHVLDGVAELEGHPTVIRGRPSIAVLRTSLLLAAGIAIGCAPLIAALNAMKLDRPPHSLTLGDTAESFGIAVLLTSVVMLWSGFEVRRFGLGHPQLMLRRALRIYISCAILVLAIAAAAAAVGVTQGLTASAAFGQLSFVFVVGTLALGALVAIGKALLRLLARLVA